MSPRHPIPSRLRLGALLAVALLLSPSPASAKPDHDKNKGRKGAPPAPTLQGTYDVTFAGALSGSGTATVGASSVSLSATPRDRGGHSVSFTIDSLIVLDGRFSGTASVDGADAPISGRADVPNESNLNSARLAATVTLPSGAHARLVGKRTS